MTSKRWDLPEGAQVNSSQPAAVVEHLLDRRGLTGVEERERFLNPLLRDLADPFRLPDMEAAVRRVELALARGELILIVSDYDVDGMSSGALLYRFLMELGAKGRVFIPERGAEGYGLSFAVLKRALAEEKPGLLMALDCGTTSVDEIAWLKEQGIDTVIIDHHELSAELPQATAFVNPQRGESGDRDLATAGLVFKFCHAFLKMQRNNDLFDLKQHLDFVALGTVADLVPLRGDNRILVRHGLLQMKSTTHIGLKTLMDVAGVPKKLSPSTVGFILGPRLNASGRLAEALSGWELLTTRDAGRATELARDLDSLNRERQKLEQQAFDSALDMVLQQPPAEREFAVVVASPDWHQGVVGIVASRLQRRFYRPVVVIALAEDSGKGSARCIEGCSIMDALRDNAAYLKNYGGHAMAAGLGIDIQQVAPFRAALNQWFQKSVSPEVYHERLAVDLEIPGKALTEALAVEMGRLEPFGKQNEAPVFMVRGIKLSGEPKVFGQQHVRFQAVADQVRFAAVGFSQAENFPRSQSLDLAGHWEMDSFTGRPCFRFLDCRAAA